MGDIGQMIGTVLVVNLIGVGVLVMASVRIVAGFWPTIPRALLCAALVFFLTVFVAWSMPFAFGSAAGRIPTWAIMFVLNAVIMNSLIRKPDGASMGLLTAGLAALVQIAVEAAVIVVLAIVLG